MKLGNFTEEEHYVARKSVKRKNASGLDEIVLKVCWIKQFDGLFIDYATLCINKTWQRKGEKLHLLFPQERETSDHSKLLSHNIYLVVRF